MSKYRCKVIAGMTQYEKEDMFGETALDAIAAFIRQYVPRDAIIIGFEVIDVEKTVQV
jgi:succinate-acetate transporter protein